MRRNRGKRNSGLCFVLLLEINAEKCSVGEGVPWEV